ncbi:GDP-mannose 4,6-dehydratase [bacterium]|nr:GDP-mannose 4,6-dehydratase [bacterium]
MDRVLIIGSEGFVGTYLKKKLNGTKNKIFYSDLLYKNDKNYFKMDISDFEEVRSIIKKVKPNVVFFLAAQSSVKQSIENPQYTFKINVEGLINVLESLKEIKTVPYFIFVSTIEVYNSKKGRINEKSSYECNNPYSISKFTGEKLIEYYKNINAIKGIILQPVGHLGPGQRDIFSMSSFAHQIALLEKNNGSKLLVGNLDIGRDLLDVRDVIDFYYKIISEKPDNFEKVILASGNTYQYRNLLDKLLSFSTNNNIKVVIDKKRLRKLDTNIINVSPSYILAKFMWKSSTPIENTLEDMLNYWRGLV